MPGQQLEQAGPPPKAAAAAAAAATLTYYPFYTFSLSPTFNTWAKLTCHTIQHELRANSSFPSRLLLVDNKDYNNGNGYANAKNRLLLFYLNHPIQYVQVTGVIVSIDEHHLQQHQHYGQGQGQGQDQLTILSLDDGSGAIVDVVFQHQDSHQHSHHSSGSNTKGNNTNTKPDSINININTDTDTARILQLLPSLAVGTVFRAKGTLSQFRGRRQVQLLRGEVVGSTGAEMRLVGARARFYSSVLAKPWVVSARRMAGLKEQMARADSDRERARRRRAERERRHADRVRREWERDEVERAAEAEVARRAGEEVEVVRREWKKKNEKNEKKKRKRMD